ncbi:MAG: asparagine synthase-related protein, partial [Cyanobacteria bacterium P01_D01_bin.56]
HSPSHEITDSQLILSSYERWQGNCADKLVGDFSFAIWDGYRKQIFCARDPMGVKPFYYYWCPQFFCFASEIRALLQVPGVPRQLNELKVGCHLALFGDEPTHTFYQNVLKLPAAHGLRLAAKGSPKVERYWSLDPHREIHLNSDDDYTEAFLEVFTEAVRCRLRSAFPIGSSLSGGLDSSSIACTARQLSTDKKVHTFSAIFPSLPMEERRWIDERYYMDAVKQLDGIQAHDVRADELNPLINRLWQDDEPICAPNLYLHQGLYQQAQSQGVRVFLDGIDGDSALSHGWPYLTELAYTGQWQTLSQLVTMAARNHRISRKSIVYRQVIFPLMVEPLMTLWQRLSHQMRQGQCGNSLVHPRLAKRTRLENHMRMLTPNNLGPMSPKKQHWSGLNSALYPNVMEIADKTAARFSLEARYPFFDRRLLEFCLALPSNQKFRDGWSRSILRFAMTDILPPAVQWRRGKGQLGANFIRRFGLLEKETLERMMVDFPSIQPYVDETTLRSAYNGYIVRNNFNGDDAMTLLSAVTLSKWLERFSHGAFA